MKHKIQIFAFLLAGIVGCHAQIPSNPTAYTCNAATDVATWTPLETSATEVTALKMTDSTVTPGTWCYAVTAIINTSNPIGQSAASNVAMVTVPSGDVTNLAWLAPTTGPAPTGYIMYRIAAIQTTITAPTLSTPAAVATLEKPALPDAKSAPAALVAMLQPERNAR